MDKANPASMRLFIPVNALPGPHSTTRPRLSRHDGLHTFHPTHGTKGLAVERIPDFFGVGLFHHINVVDHGNLRRGK